MRFLLIAQLRDDHHKKPIGFSQDREKLAPRRNLTPHYSRRAVLAGMVLTGLLAGPGGATEAPLRIIFPYPAGGSADAVVRMIAEYLQKALSRPVVVENKTGAGGTIGAQVVKQAPADGNTILFAAAAQMVLQPHLMSGLSYDPFTDFVPISQVINFDQAMAVNSQIPASDIETLVAWIKADPQRGKFGSPGEGTAPHLAGLALGRKFGLSLTHVPYRGTPLALPDLITGRLPIFISSIAELIASHRRGEIRILGTAGPGRSAHLPDVRTLVEQGVDFDASGWFGFYARAGTPPEHVAQLELRVLEAMQVPAIRSFAESLGFSVSGTSAAELGRIHREQFDRWAGIVKNSGLAMR
jgi:tripartite-type tricarboxylate transporter receptor subunit TctC